MIVGTNNFPLVNFLFVNRTADKQIYWSHGNFEYNVNNIDNRISHSSNTSNNKYNFKIFNIHFGLEKYNPEVDMKIVKSIREAYPADVTILGAIGRLIKINSDEYLETVAKIMKKNSKTIFLACGTGNQDEIKMKLKKLNILDRFYFPGYIDSHLYGHIIDLYLSPFPYGGGEAMNEFAHKGKPFVHLHQEKYSLSNLNERDFTLYTEKQKEQSFKDHPIIKENSYSSSFVNIQHTINKDDYLNVALRFIDDQILVDKVVSEFKYKDTVNRGLLSFLDILEDV